MQVLPNGNVFVGWGSAPFFSEYSKEGELLFDAEFPGSAQSYRAFRFPWKGDPADDPAVAVDTRTRRQSNALRQLERRHRGRELGGARRP